MHALYAYIYVTDRDEGLILVPAGTLLDGNPLNNFLGRELTFNPDGILKGARAITIVGTYAYISCNAGLVVISLEDPKHPSVTSVLGEPFLKHPRAVQVQFRYAFACDAEGVKVLDITDLAHPQSVSTLPLNNARNIYLARTYAYVAAGPDGLVILDIERPAQPRVDQVFNAGGCIDDLNDVKLGITYVSEFAYLADGRNGLRVVQLTSPETPGNYGFSPRPTPQLIANFKLPLGGKAAGDLGGPRPRPRRGRIGEPDRRLRPRRRPATQCPGAAEDVPAQQPDLESERRPPRPDLPASLGILEVTARGLRSMISSTVMV